MNNIKGHIVSVGGGLNNGCVKHRVQEERHLTFTNAQLLTKAVYLMENIPDPIVELITTESPFAEEVVNCYKLAFSQCGSCKVRHIPINSRHDVDNPEYLHRIINCHFVVFTGCDQLRLSSIFGGTEFLEILKQRYANEEFIIAGTNAAAAVMGHSMIYGNCPEIAHLRDELKMSTGLGFIQEIMIDTHFHEKGRFNRLVQAVATQPGIVGIGLGENTGIIFSNGEQIKAIGGGLVTIVDGRNIRHNNIADIKDGNAFSVENMIVHVISANQVYNLNSRRFESNKQEFPVAGRLKY